MGILLAILPVVIIGWYIYSKDRNKEPKKILFKLFLYGILSSFLSICLSNIFSLVFPIMLKDASKLNYLELFFYVFIGIALIEEFSKWLMLYLLSFKSKEFDEIYDMIVYAVFVSLGFAAFENILYIIDGGISVALLRAITAIPGHTCYGILMGYYLSKTKMCIVDNKRLYIKNIILSILIPTIIHGIYDYCLFSLNSYLFIIFVLFLIYMHILSFFKIKEIIKISNLFYKKNYCNNCGMRVGDYNYCSNCGSKI